VDALFCSGGAETSPLCVNDLSSVWPQPWICWRFLLAAGVVIFLFVFGLEYFKNLNTLPGMIMTASFGIPLTVLLFFYEMNAPRNVPFYKVMAFIVIGGIVAIIVSLFIWKTELGVRLDTFMGAMSAGLIEETAKFLVATVLILRMSGRKWTHQGMLVGAAVGVGFAGFETMGYGTRAFLSDYSAWVSGGDLQYFLQYLTEQAAKLGTRHAKALQEILDYISRTSAANGSAYVSAPDFYDTLLQRGLFSPFCHVIWTALTAGAICGEIGNRRFSLGMLFHWRVLRVFLFVVVLHMFWNSGLLWWTQGTYNLSLVWIYGALVAFVGSWQAVLMMIQKGINEIRGVKDGDVAMSQM